MCGGGGGESPLSKDGSMSKFRTLKASQPVCQPTSLACPMPNCQPAWSPPSCWGAALPTPPPPPPPSPNEDWPPLPSLCCLILYVNGRTHKAEETAALTVCQPDQNSRTGVWLAHCRWHKEQKRDKTRRPPSHSHPMSGIIKTKSSPPLPPFGGRREEGNCFSSWLNYWVPVHVLTQEETLQPREDLSLWNPAAIKLFLHTLDISFVMGWPLSPIQECQQTHAGWHVPPLQEGKLVWEKRALEPSLVLNPNISSWTFAQHPTKVHFVQCLMKCIWKLALLHPKPFFPHLLLPPSYIFFNLNLAMW